jgi:hypothetical protein
VPLSLGLLPCVEGVAAKNEKIGGNLESEKKGKGMRTGPSFWIYPSGATLHPPAPLHPCCSSTQAAPDQQFVPVKPQPTSTPRSMPPLPRRPGNATCCRLPLASVRGSTAALHRSPAAPLSTRSQRPLSNMRLEADRTLALLGQGDFKAARPRQGRPAEGVAAARRGEPVKRQGNWHGGARNGGDNGEKVPAGRN